MFKLILLPSCYLSQLRRYYVKHKPIILYSRKINKHKYDNSGKPIKQNLGEPSPRRTIYYIK